MEFYTVTNTEFNEIDKEATRIEHLFDEVKELKLCKSIDWFGYDKCDIYVHSQCRINPGLGKFAFAIIRQRNGRIIHEEWKKVKITKTTSREIELLSVIESLLWIPLGNKVDINVFVHSHELFTLLVNLNKLKEVNDVIIFRISHSISSYVE